MHIDRKSKHVCHRTACCSTKWSCLLTRPVNNQSILGTLVYIIILRLHVRTCTVRIRTYINVPITRMKEKLTIRGRKTVHWKGFHRIHQSRHDELAIGACTINDQCLRTHSHIATPHHRCTTAVKALSERISVSNVRPPSPRAWVRLQIMHKWKEKLHNF